MNKDVKLIWESYTLVSEGLEQKMPHLIQQFPDLAEPEIRALAGYDPTGDKAKWVTWILKYIGMPIKNGWAHHLIGLEEPEEDADYEHLMIHLFAPYAWNDGYKITDLLEKWMAYGGQRQYQEFVSERAKQVHGDPALINKPGDIMSYEQRWLYDYIKQYEEKVLGMRPEQFSDEVWKRLAQRGEIKQIMQEGIYGVWQFNSENAARRLCKDTRWCIAQGAYDEYQGPGLFMFTKNMQPWILAHVGEKEIKDWDDDPIQEEDAIEVYPIANKIPALYPLVNNIYPEWVMEKIIDNPSMIGDYLKTKHEVQETFNVRTFNDILRNKPDRMNFVDDDFSVGRIFDMLRGERGDPDTTGLDALKSMLEIGSRRTVETFWKKSKKFREIWTWVVYEMFVEKWLEYDLGDRVDTIAEPRMMRSGDFDVFNSEKVRNHLGNIRDIRQDLDAHYYKALKKEIKVPALADIGEVSEGIQTYLGAKAYTDMLAHQDAVWEILDSDQSRESITWNIGIRERELKRRK